ncbi:MAG: hypothetical protein D6732_02390 [Methanobacteriota archaeon]|nr:MAG: hypothetical protein D6732_02390 [Euryarchaeota archaeon]
MDRKGLVALWVILTFLLVNGFVILYFKLTVPPVNRTILDQTGIAIPGQVVSFRLTGQERFKKFDSMDSCLFVLVTSLSGNFTFYESPVSLSGLENHTEARLRYGLIPEGRELANCINGFDYLYLWFGTIDMYRIQVGLIVFK